MATPQSARPLRSVRRPKRVPSPLYDANAPAPISLTAIHKKEAPADQVDQQMHAPMPPMLARKSCSFSDDVLPTPAPLPEPSHDARESVPSGPLPIKDPLDSLRAWTREDVQSWLSGSEIEQENLAKAAFDDHIDGAVLAEMGPDAWAELGVLSAIQRCKLIAAVKKAAASGERPQRTIIRRSTSSDSLRGSDKIPEFEVLCRCTIQKLQIESLDKGAKGVFTAYVKFEASWRDNCKAIRELATGGKKLCDDMIDKNESGPSKLRLKQQRSGVEEPFTPRIQFMNCIAKEDERSFYSIKGWTEKDPVVRYCTFFTGTFNLRNMDLRLFPIDEQMLTIEVQSGWERPESVAPSAGEVSTALSGRDSNGGRKSSLRTLAAQRSTAYLKNVTLKRAEGDKKHSALSVNTISFAVKNQYRLTHALFFDEKTSHPRDSSENFEYSQLLISMHVRRRSWYYLHNIIAPSFIITSSLLATYGLDRHDATRLEVSITVLLALTAFKFVLVEKVPDVDYATIIDWYARPAAAPPGSRLLFCYPTTPTSPLVPSHCPPPLAAAHSTPRPTPPPAGTCSRRSSSSLRSSACSSSPSSACTRSGHIMSRSACRRGGQTIGCQRATRHARRR